MGTPSVIGFRIKGEWKEFASHQDGYPTGIGLGIMIWLQHLSEEDIEKMIEQLGQLEWVDRHKSQPSKELQHRYSAAGFSMTHMGPMMINEGKTDNWTNLLYRMEGGRCLPQILDGSLRHLMDDTNSYNWDYGYWLNFEERTLEIAGLDDTFIIRFDEIDNPILITCKLQNPDMSEEKFEKLLKWVRNCGKMRVKRRRGNWREDWTWHHGLPRSEEEREYEMRDPRVLWGPQSGPARDDDDQYETFRRQRWVEDEEDQEHKQLCKEAREESS